MLSGPQMFYRQILILTVVALAGSTSLFAQQASHDLRVLDPIIEASIDNHETPGAVLLVGHDGAIIYRKAYGNRSLEPKIEPMTVDTIFDLASLTKVIATTTAVMQLEEQGWSYVRP